MDYSKFINLETWPPKPEEKKKPEQKDEFSEKVRQHFRDNPEALAEFQKELKEQGKTDDQENPLSKSLLKEPETEGGASPDILEYLKTKKH